MLLCTAFEEKTVLRSDKKRFWKIFLEKFPQRFGCFENLPYLCTTFRFENGVGVKKRVLKIQNKVL